MEWVIILFIVAAIPIIYMVYEANINRVIKHAIELEGDASPLTIFFISDLHNRLLSNKLIKQIDQKVDFVIIGGDLVDKRTSKQKLATNLERLTNVAPTYFVVGNNDPEFNQQTLKTMFSIYGVEVLSNSSKRIRSGEASIRLVAVDFDEDEQKISQAFQHCHKEDVVLFIAHNPEDAAVVRQLKKPLLTMSGHVHGGQIRIGKYRKFPLGHFKKIGQTYELISNGYGTTLFPLRFQAKPEAHILTITWKSSGK